MKIFVSLWTFFGCFGPNQIQAFTLFTSRLQQNVCLICVYAKCMYMFQYMHLLCISITCCIGACAVRMQVTRT